MKIKKILAAVAASTMMLSTMAITAGAEKIDMDASYGSNWGCSALVNFEKLADYTETGVEVTVNVAYQEDTLIYNQACIKPINVEKSWVTLNEAGKNQFITGLPVQGDLTEAEIVEKYDACFKNDGFIALNQTKKLSPVKFTITKEGVNEIISTEGNLAFQYFGAYVTSIELNAPGSSTDKPATDNTDTPVTGNAGVAGLVVIAALATAGVVISKRK